MFGIQSASEVFQHRMHELIEGLNGVEVVTDDFAIYGRGQMDQETSADHDKCLIAYLQRCRERRVVFGRKKIQLRQKIAPFIRHVATPHSLSVAPGRV